MNGEMERTTKGYSRDIYLILATGFFYMASPMLVTPLITGFSGTLGASGAVMGIIGGLMNFCSLFCRPFAGILTDRVSKCRFASFGALLVFLGTIGYVLAPNMAVVVAARVLSGVGYSCCSVCMSTWMSDMLPKDRIGSGMGIYGTMNALSMAIAPALGVAVYNRLGYRSAFLLSVVFALCCFLSIQLIRDKGLPAKNAERKKGLPPLIEIRALPVAAIIMLFTIPYCATQSFLVSYVENRQAPVSAGLFFPLYAVILLFLRITLKSRFDKWPFRVFFLASCCCALLSMSALAALDSIPTMIAAAVFMAGGYGVMCSVCQSTAILLAGEGRRGVANSTYYIGLDLGMTLGPLFGGILYDAVPNRLFYPCLMVCVPVSILVFLIWRAALKRRR